MAKSKENLYLFGLSGSVGKQMVFRNTARGTILAKSPRHTGKKTEHQKEQGKKFLKAVAYAKQALADSSLSAIYKKLAAASPNKLSAYNIAVADYLRPPVIEHIDTTAYKGDATGEKILITVTDNVKVTAVKVRIESSDESDVEQGNATLHEGKWLYVTTATNASIGGDKIIVTATDRPGNNTTKEVVL